MAINFRGRIDGCTEDDTGNYEDVMSYRKEDYATPSLVRQSVNGPPYIRAMQSPIPSNWEHATQCTYGAITNWSTFAREMDVAAFDGKQLLHLPLFDWQKSTPASVFGAMCIFKPKEGNVAVLVAGKQGLIDGIKKSGMVGEPLSIDF